MFRVKDFLIIYMKLLKRQIFSDEMITGCLGPKEQRKEGRKEMGKKQKLVLQSPKRAHRVKTGCHHGHIISTQKESNKQGQSGHLTVLAGTQLQVTGSLCPHCIAK